MYDSVYKLQKKPDKEIDVKKNINENYSIPPYDNRNRRKKWGLLPMNTPDIPKEKPKNWINEIFTTINNTDLFIIKKVLFSNYQLVC